MSVYCMTDSHVMYVLNIVFVGLQSGSEAEAVCPGQRGAGARHHGAADRHGADPVLHPDMEPGLQ